MLAFAVVLVVVASIASNGSAATSGTTVGATVLSSVTLSTASCGTSATSLGTIVPGTTRISPSACRVDFGSSNATSTLRMYQRDASASAMTQMNPSWTVRRALGSYNDVAAEDASKAWMVGSGATGGPLLRRTTDGGATWTNQAPCTGAGQIYGLAVLAAGTAITAGNSSRICRTVDGGTTWTTASSMSAAWRDLDCTGAVCWAVGANGKAAISLDSGQTWAARPVPQLDTLNGVVAFSSTDAIAVGRSPGSPTSNLDTWRTSDGGTTWTLTVLASAQPVAYTLNDVARSASGVTVAVGATGTYRSTDDGATWTKVGSGAWAVRSLGAGRWLEANTVSRVSTNDGLTWASGPSLPPSMAAISPPVAGAVWIAGDNETGYRTSDGGSTFSAVTPVLPDYYGALAWSTSSWVVFGGSGELVRTTDGGATLATVPTGTTVALNAGAASAAGVGIVVGDNGTILRTTDAGASWSPVTSGSGADLESALWSPESGRFWVGGSSGTVLRSADGITWAAVSAAGSSTIRSVQVAPDGQTLYAGCTCMGTVYRSVNLGASWTALPAAPVTAFVRDLLRTSSGTLLLATEDDAGSNSYVWRSVDEGATWTQVRSSTTSSYEFEPGSGGRVFLGASSGNVAQSDDDGLTWTTINTPAAGAFYGLAAIDRNTLVGAGGGQLISTSTPAASVADVNVPTTTLGTAASAFGFCLETAGGVASAGWAAAGTGNCTVANSTAWRGVSTTSGGPNAGIGSTAAPGTGSVDLRFGLTSSTSQAVGAYSADLVFEAVSP